MFLNCFETFLELPVYPRHGAGCWWHKDKDRVSSEAQGELETQTHRQTISIGHAGAGPELCAGHYGSAVQGTT